MVYVWICSNGVFTLNDSLIHGKARKSEYDCSWKLSDGLFQWCCWANEPLHRCAERLQSGLDRHEYSLQLSYSRCLTQEIIVMGCDLLSETRQDMRLLWLTWFIFNFDLDYQNSTYLILKLLVEAFDTERKT